MKKIALFAVLALSITVMSEAAFAMELRIFTCQEPPLNYSLSKKSYASQQKVTGFTTDIVREILKRTNESSTIELIPWPRAYQNALHDKNVFLFSMARTEQRENDFKWVGPIAKKKIILLARKDSGITINSLDDARNVGSIGTMLHDSKRQYLLSRGFMNLETSPSWESNLKKLQEGRVDLIAQTDLDLPIIALKAGVDLKAIREVYAMYSNMLYIGVSKSTSDTIVKKWQQALDSIKEDGTFQKLIADWAKYYNTSSWVYQDGMLQVKYD